MAGSERVYGPETARGGHAGGSLTPEAARLAAWALYLVVFTSGGVLMGVEIAGSRVLAPSFGTSIFVWGSLIGLFMGAMALGYYLGGALADRRPSFTLLAAIVSLAGVYTFLVVPYLGTWMCEGIALQVTGRALGPLLAAAALFFVPSFLMAMVSPFAVKLHAQSLSSVGGVAGKLYALSTTGSIVGTLLTTFALIPLFRVTNVLQGLGVALLLIAVLSLLAFKRAVGGSAMLTADRRGAAILALVALGCLEGWVVWPVQPHVAEYERLLRYEESSYHDIAVTEQVRDRGGLLQPAQVRRWLKFNENTESGIYPYLGKYKNAVHYTDLFHLALLWAPQPKRMLVVGGGGAIAPTQFKLFYPSLETMEVLELDATVERLAKQYFQAGAGVTFYIGDARTNLRQAAGPYDIIVLDAYSAGGQIPFHLLTWEFLKEVKQKLSPQGVLITNIIAALENDDPPRERPADLYFAECRTLRASEAEAHRLAHPTAEQQQPLFKQVYVFPKIFEREGNLLGRESAYRNVIVFATLEAQARTAETINEQARAFIEGRDPERRVDKELFLWHAASLWTRGPKPEQLARVPILCDDYAPVDTMYRPVKFDEGTWRD